MIKIKENIGLTYVFFCIFALNYNKCIIIKTKIYGSRIERTYQEK